MPKYALLISPRADGAYFAQTIDVAKAELGGALPSTPVEHKTAGDLRFLVVEAPESSLSALLRLSFVQGAFAIDQDRFHPIEATANFSLHPDFVWGEKYRGKTSETLTQLLINLCLQVNPDTSTLLDPMCGRATTLLWGMRYGLKTAGIEQDPTALQDIQRGVKKWSKLHRQKHALSQGWVQKANKKGSGKFLEFSAEGASMKVITGDAKDAQTLLQNRKFDALATDIPYGVQHMGGKTSRSPIEGLHDAAEGWVKSLKPGGALAIAFNSYLPKRAEILAIFEECGMEEISANVSHRMSESIVRDVLLMRKPDL